MSRVLVVGATRGLGAALARVYAHKGKTVFATSRSSAPQTDKFPDGVHFITGVDLMKPDVGDKLTSHLKGKGPLEEVVWKNMAGYVQ
jgi:NAD(P)-dependent dehydrogenase (short-subunit alcohol dehydrogenase family)